MPQKNEDATNEISTNNNFNIINILLLDHNYLKECIKVLKNENQDNVKQDKELKYSYAKSFLDTFSKHSKSEKSALYEPLKLSNEYRTMVLKAEIQHELIDKKIESLIVRMEKMRALDEMMEIEMSVLADLIEHHLREEEQVIFPKMMTQIDSHILNEMGLEFLMKRKFTEKDLENVPALRGEISFINKAINLPSSDRVARTHEYFS